MGQCFGRVNQNDTEIIVLASWRVKNFTVLLKSSKKRGQVWPLFFKGYYLTITNSTRRFSARPSAVSLLAIGLASP